MRLLVVDLESKTFEYIMDESLRHSFIGGVGVNTYLMYRFTEEGVTPFDRGNDLFFSPGAFVGTGVPTASRCEVSAISPTGYFGTSNTGGRVGLAIRQCGIDTIWIRGKSESPVYLVIDEGGVFFKDGDLLWGKDTFETTSILKEREGGDTCVVCIGQAGERGVHFASIHGEFYHAFGRTGLGAIMGGKMLKAICLKGQKGIKIRDKRQLKELTEKIRNRLISSDTFGYTRRYGSMVVSDVYNRLGILPGHNYRKGSYENWEETRGRRVFEERYKIRDLACVSCPIGCMHWSKVRDGIYDGYETKGLEVTFALEFGGKLDIQDIPQIFQCVELCNRFGMDVISTSSVIAYAIELFEKGFLKEKDIGFKIAFGDFDSIYKLILMIGRNEGIGNILGKGIRAMKEEFKGSDSFACEIKGVEMPVRDPRGRFDPWMLGLFINVRGGDHLRIRTPVDDLKPFVNDYKYEPLSLKQEAVELLDIPEKIKEAIMGTPPSRIDIVAMTKYGEDYLTLLNACGMCIRPPVLRTIGPSILAEAFNTLFGYGLDDEDLLTISERIVNMAHLFNLKRGLTLGEYRYPERFYSEGIEYSGKTHPPLDRKKVEEMLLRYCELRGWDEKGQVKKETMERLKLWKR
ncbi:MAG: hypothetical protein N2745_09120 [Syntrophorhabdaceae bacterium]|nr:hypothetical protein [Syntrophorhabdaceae bacterium]